MFSQDTEDPMREVVVCFLDSSSDAVRQHWLNTAAERLAPPTRNGASPKIHCEILFPDHDNQKHGLSCSICYDGRVFLMRKRFTKVEWSFRVLRKIPSHVFDSMKTFCKACTGDYFNHIGYALYGVTSGNVRLSGSWTSSFYPMTRRWFCSEIVIEALKVGGYLPEHISSVQHPETLYQLLIQQSAAGTGRAVTAYNL